MDFKEAVNEISRLGLEHDRSSDEDCELYESDAETIILYFVKDNKIEIPGFDLSAFILAYDDDDEDYEGDSWSEIIGDIIIKANEDDDFKKKLPSQFISLLIHYYTSFGWEDFIK